MNPWFVRFNSAPMAKSRLFCFPYAGGSAEVFESWGLALHCVDVVAIQIPGRGRRFSEKPLESLADIVGVLADEICDVNELPFTFFGHSLGALICFELARELRRRGAKVPEHIILSGSRAPHLPRMRRDIHLLPFDEFIERLRLMNGTPDAVLQDRELMELYMPALRADFKVCETYQYVSDVRLDSSASLFFGVDDREVQELDVRAWRDEFSASDVRCVQFPGDHFFINTQRSLVVNAVRGILNSLPLRRVSVDVE